MVTYNDYVHVFFLFPLCQWNKQCSSYFKQSLQTSKSILCIPILCSISCLYWHYCAVHCTCIFKFEIWMGSSRTLNFAASWFMVQQIVFNLKWTYVLSHWTIMEFYAVCDGGGLLLSKHTGSLLYENCGRPGFALITLCVTFTIQRPLFPDKLSNCKWLLTRNRITVTDHAYFNVLFRYFRVLGS